MCIVCELFKQRANQGPRVHGLAGGWPRVLRGRSRDSQFFPFLPFSILRFLAILHSPPCWPRAPHVPHLPNPLCGPPDSSSRRCCQCLQHVSHFGFGISTFRLAAQLLLQALAPSCTDNCTHLRSVSSASATFGQDVSLSKRWGGFKKPWKWSTPKEPVVPEALYFEHRDRSRCRKGRPIEMKSLRSSG